MISLIIISLASPAVIFFIIWFFYQEVRELQARVLKLEHKTMFTSGNVAKIPSRRVNNGE